MANTKHAVVRIDKLGGTLDGAQLESAIFYKESDAAEIDNGQLVVLGEKLGRPCRIVNGKKKGRIELEYYGTDDLNALLEALETLGKK